MPRKGIQFKGMNGKQRRARKTGNNRMMAVAENKATWQAGTFWGKWGDIIFFLTYWSEPGDSFSAFTSRRQKQISDIQMTHVYDQQCAREFQGGPSHNYTYHQQRCFPVRLSDIAHRLGQKRRSIQRSTSYEKALIT